MEVITMFYVLFFTHTINVCLGISKTMLDEMMRDSEDGNIDAMFDKVGDALGELVDSFQQLDSACKFSCENGKKPVPRKDHKPSTNGCGSFGFKFDTSSLPLMTKCCDNHDYCYDTCNSDKAKCDKVFKKCLLKMCDTMEYALTDEEFEGCKATADMVHTGTEMLGCKSYKKAQAEACDCGTVKQLPPSSSAEKSSKAQEPEKKMKKVSGSSGSEKFKNAEHKEKETWRKSEEKATEATSDTKSKGNKPSVDSSNKPKKTTDEGKKTTETLIPKKEEL